MVINFIYRLYRLAHKKLVKQENRKRKKRRKKGRERSIETMAMVNTLFLQFQSYFFEFLKAFIIC